MSLYLALPGSTLEGAFTTNTAISSALVNSLIEGQSLYRLALTGAGWVTQGLPQTNFTVSGNVATVTGIGNIVTGTGPCQVSNSGGALPTGLSAATDYWLITTGLPQNQFQFATSWANAMAGTPVTLSSAGTGTQTIDTVSVVAPGRVFIPAGGTWDFDGRNGGKLAVIQDSTGGKFALSVLVSVK